MFSIIAAIGKNNELGKDNGLIWHLPNDLKFFKEKTMNKNIVMGSTTFESLGRLLPNRHHIVLAFTNDFPKEVEVFNSIEDLLKKYSNSKEEIFIIGGASIYRQFIDLSERMYLTEINAECKDASVYFPTFNKDDWDREVLAENQDDDISYKHVLYRRK